MYLLSPETAQRGSGLQEKIEDAMKKQLLFLSAFLLIFFSGFSQSFSQSYSGIVHTFTGKSSMVNKEAQTRLLVNSKSNESTEAGRYRVYFTYSSNYDGVKKGMYKVKIYRYLGKKMQIIYYDLNIGVDMPRFYDYIDLVKGVYSIRVFDKNGILLGHSDYFNVTSDKSKTQYAEK